MTKEWSDPRLEALDVVREAMRQIYDAKRARMATAKDDVRLKELHVQWMAVMRRSETRWRTTMPRWYRLSALWQTSGAEHQARA